MKVFKVLLVSLILLLAVPVLLAQKNNEDQDFKKLIPEYEQLYNQNPSNQQIKTNLSVIYHNHAIDIAQNEEWLLAITEQEKALKLFPDEEIMKITMAGFLNAYALELRKQKRFRDALNTLTRAINFNPDQVQLKKNIAVIYLDLAYQAFENEESNNSDYLLRSAASYDQDNPYIHMLSGELAYKVDDYYKAEKDWEKAFKLNSQIPHIKEKLEKVRKEREIEGKFKSRYSGNFKLKFEGVEKSDLAYTASEILREAYREVGRDFDVFPNKVIAVIIYPDEKLQNLGYFPDWAAGIYDGKIRIGERLGKDSMLLKGVLYHEYAHVVIHHLAKDNVPLWFNEGLAEYEARKFKRPYQRKGRRQMLLKANRKKLLLDFNQLAGMQLVELNQLSSETLELVYAQSESFVSYLIERYSIYHITTVLKKLGDSQSIEKAIRDSLFVDLDRLIKDWKEWLSEANIK